MPVHWPLLPVVVEQTSAGEDGLVRRWPAPGAGADKHRIYMVQWYTFAALAAGLYPFVVPDLLKIAAASGVMPALWRLLGR